jgi:hypothetical protein
MSWDMWHVCKVLVSNLQGKRPLGIPRHMRIILKLILKKNNWKAWTVFLWLRIGTSGGLL